MDKTTKFTPSREEAIEFADNYWSDLSDYNEKKLNSIKDTITNSAKRGKYEVVVDVLKGREDYFKEILEESGYIVTMSNSAIDKKYINLIISFEK
ncbi:hypothetical protein TPDSL_17910 [Terrisporobacter petrolearius]|uniref:hypothetical protein n=1 Tax=Terrisporobacter petrolearius TaxID=1460447 RepID=UPI003365E8B1